jgi:hypothetical protein
MTGMDDLARGRENSSVDQIRSARARPADAKLAPAFHFDTAKTSGVDGADPIAERHEVWSSHRTYRELHLCRISVSGV